MNAASSSLAQHSQKDHFFDFTSVRIVFVKRRFIEMYHIIKNQNSGNAKFLSNVYKNIIYNSRLLNLGANK